MPSTQVLEEFYVNVTRKIPKPISRAAAREVLRHYTVWQVESVGPEPAFTASEIEERYYQLSFWDALLVAAARQGGRNGLVRRPARRVVHGRDADREPARRPNTGIQEQRRAACAVVQSPSPIR